MKRMCVSVVAILLAALGAGAAAAADYKVDEVHSAVIFRVQHLNVGMSYGRFNDMSGTFTLDADPAKIAMDIKVKTGSVDTNSKARDKHLEGPDFFNAKQYPALTFKSKSAKKGDGDKIQVTGDLTCHGVTKEITVTLDHTAEAKTAMGERGAFETTFTISRAAYGINYEPGALGDEVRIVVSIEGVKK